MVFSDAQPFFPNLAEAIQYKSNTGFVADKPVLKRFDVGLSSAPQSVSFRNYNFQTMKIPEGSAQGQQSDKANNAIEPNLEYYDYPNPHIDKGKGNRLAQKEIERLRTNHILAEGYSDLPNLHTGYFFTVEGYPAIDTLDSQKPWLLKQIRHQGRQPQVIEALGGSASADSSNTPSQLEGYYRLPIAEELQFPLESFEQGYRNCFIATPQAVVYRPAILHPKPRILGSQTAIVTGASGEEIYCDEYGRVKIQFHWDREGSYDENSSHWVRVASSWAHDGYGTVVIPRVGMEVMINFLEGDIDNPLITGALHNGVNKPPYDLPANKTRSVFKTSSSKGGIGSNELRIEDKAGEEQIFIQSQKDFDQLTKNNHTVEVKNNSHLQVNNEHSETIKKNRYTKNQSEEHHLTQLDRKTQILQNDYKEVAMAEHTTIGTIKTTEAGMEIHLKSGMQTVIDGGLSLTLKAGGQHIVLNPAGIWMTTPQWMGGVPMEGTPAIPLAPLAKENAVAPTLAPPIIFKNGFKQIAEKQTGSYRGTLTLIDNKQKPIPDQYYKITTAQGTVLAEGFTNPEGKGVEVATDEGSEATVYLGKGGWTFTEQVLLANRDECSGCCGDEPVYKGQLHFIDKNQTPIPDAYYKIVDTEGIILAKGVTDEQGKSEEIISHTGSEATLYLGQGGWTLTEETIINSECCC